jgi:hypothetical protein
LKDGSYRKYHKIHGMRQRFAEQKAVIALLPGGGSVSTQFPVALEDSEPEPDLVIVRGTADDFRERHPGSDEIGLVVEVADSSLQRDRADKGRMYARARIPFTGLSISSMRKSRSSRAQPGRFVRRAIVAIACSRRTRRFP